MLMKAVRASRTPPARRANPPEGEADVGVQRVEPVEGVVQGDAERRQRVGVPPALRERVISTARRRAGERAVAVSSEAGEAGLAAAGSASSTAFPAAISAIARPICPRYASDVPRRIRTRAASAVSPASVARRTASSASRRPRSPERCR